MLRHTTIFVQIMINMDINKQKPGAKPGNTNAQAGDNPATSTLQIRCTPGEKAAWVRAANGLKLSDWVRERLNSA